MKDEFTTVYKRQVEMDSRMGDNISGGVDSKK